MSTAEVRQELLPYFRTMFKTDKEFQLRMALDLGMEDEEVAFILEEKLDSNAVKHVMSDMKKVVDAKGKKMERAIDREKLLEAMDDPPAPAARPQPSGSQRTLF
jgi:replication factor C large subunit